MNGLIKTTPQILPLEKRLMLDASLPVIADNVLWLDASDASTILDADGDNADTGTGGNNDGFSGAVQTWQDKSGSTFNVTAAGVGNRPQYGVDIQNGNGVITLDGNDDWLRNTTAQIAGNEMTMFIVYNRDAATSRDALMEVGSGGNRNGMFIFTTNYISYYSNGTFDNGDGTQYTFDEYHVSTVTHSGTTATGSTDGVQFLNEPSNNRTTTTGIYIGNDSSDGDELKGTIAEVLVYDRALTTDESHDIETYLAGKWGFPITNTDPTLDTNAGLTVEEAATLAITNTELVSSDADNSNGNLTYTITDALDNGTLTNTNTASALGLYDTFTQSDIDNGYITYTHNGNSASADSFIFTLSDGYSSVANQTFSITINQTGTFSNVDAIANAVQHYDASDIDGDGNTNDQPSDGASVTSWVDNRGAQVNTASGSGSSAPTYDSNAFSYNTGGLVFDGVNDIMTMGATSEVNTSTYSEKSFAFTFKTGADVVSDQVIYEQGGTSNGVIFGLFGGNIYADVYYGGTGGTHYTLNLGAATANTTYQLVSVFDNNTANTFSASLNQGGLVTTATSGNLPAHSGAPGFGKENGTTINPATLTNATNLYFQGALGEFWVWNGALTAGEFADVQDYLQDKWFDTAHSITENNTLDVQEDEILSITNAYLDTDDLESPDSAITYTLTSLPAQGTLYLNGIALGLNDTFTQDDINNGVITFDHDGTAAPNADSFDFTVTDGFSANIASTFNFNIVALDSNDPILSANATLTLNEGASDTITNALLEIVDSDTADTNLTYTITSDVSTGALYNNGVALGVNDTFTQDDINNNLITYTHNDAEVFIDSFSFEVTDGIATTATSAFSIIITPVNDETPTDIAASSTNVNENVANNTVVATLTTTDADLPGDTFTYSLISNPGNKFKIVDDELQAKSGLNYEAISSYNLTIRVSDGTNTYDKAFTININDLNENPTDIALNNSTILENSALGTVVGTLSATDPDLPDDTFTYTITADPDNKFTIVGNELRIDGNIDFETSASHNVTVQVSDGNGGTRSEIFTITVTADNDTPIVTSNDQSIAQGNSVTLNNTILDATDQDNVDAGLIYTITSAPTDGTLTLNGVTLTIGSTFTGQDILDGTVVYTHDNNSINTASDNFSFTVTDGVVTTATDTLTFNINISKNLNDGPTVDEGAETGIDNTNLDYDIDWYDTNWTARRSITIPAANVSTDLTDYALLITGDGFDADFWNTVKTDGSDIIILDSFGNKLDRELVSINTGTGTMQLYVRTDLSSTVDNELTIYYGNAAGAETNATTTWTSGYKGVWHFDDDFDDGSVADSSQTGNHGFTGNGFSSANQTAGVTGSAGDFNNNEYLALNYAYSGNNTLDQVSVSAWINTTDNSGGQSDNWAIIDFDRSEFFDVFIHGDGTVGFSTSGNGLSTQDMVSTGVTVNDGNWHHIAAVYDGADKILYIDGAEVARVNDPYGGADLGQSTRYGFIGDGSEATSFDGTRNNVYYTGQYDDVRLYEGTLTAEQIAAEYANHNDPGNFFTVGAHADRTDSTTYTLTAIPVNGILYLDANANNTMDIGEQLTINGTFTQKNIDNGLLFYRHDDSNTTDDSFSFNVRDSLGNITAEQTQDITVNPIQDDGGVVIEADNSNDNTVTNTTETTNGLHNTDTRTSLHKLQNQNATGAIILAALSSSSDTVQETFYYDHEQILRENITLNLREGHQLQPSQTTQNIDPPDTTEDVQETVEESSQRVHHYTNLREALEFFEQMADESNNAAASENDAPDDSPKPTKYKPASLDAQFIDVLTYHAKKQQSLKEALLNA